MEYHQQLLHEKSFPEAEYHNLEDFACDVEDKIERFIRATSSKPLLVIINDCNCFRMTAGFEFTRRHLPDLLNNARKITDDVKEIWKEQEEARAMYGVPKPAYPEESAGIWRSRMDFLYRDPVDESDTVGFERHVKELVDVVEHLLDYNGVTLVPIVGVAGIGKTTLAKIVYRSVERHFDCSAMLCVSQIPDEYQLACDLAKQVGCSFSDYEGPSRYLWRYLAEKRYLILLDDVWDIPSWRYLANAIPSGDNISGSIIISTSRNKQVYTSEEGGELIRATSGRLAPPYELQPLDGSDSWNLFFSKMGVVKMDVAGDDDDHELLQSLREKIVRKCCGVPLAIVSAPNSIRKAIHEEERQWWKLVDYFMDNGGGVCSAALELSYQYLPVGLRLCFIYLGLFPSDDDLFATDIINQWIAEGLVARGLSVEEEEEIGESYLNDLVANSLVQVSSRRFDGRIRSFRVIDIVRSFCVWKCRDAIKTAAHPPPPGNTASRKNRLQRVTFIDRKTPPRFRGGDLRTAVTVCSNYHEGGGGGPQQIEQLLKDCDLLRVLTLGSRQFPFCLTKGLGNLKLLTHLGCSDRSLLPSAKVKLPSAMGQLNSLLTLDLRNVEYETIPERIWTLEQLRHLLLGKLSLRALSRIDANDGGTKDKKKKKINVNLPNLLTLYVVPGQLLPDEVLEKTKKLRKLGIDHPTEKTIELLAYSSAPFCPKLEILRLRFHPGKGPKLWFALSHHVNIRRLNLITTAVPRQMDIPSSTVKLVLEISHVKEEDPMQVLKLLSRLEILKLYVDKCSLDIIVCSGGPEAFPQLQILELHLPFYVRKFTVEERAMPKLKKVSGISSRMLLQVPKRISEVCVFTW